MASLLRERVVEAGEGEAQTERQGEGRNVPVRSETLTWRIMRVRSASRATLTQHTPLLARGREAGAAAVMEEEAMTQHMDTCEAWVEEVDEAVALLAAVGGVWDEAEVAEGDGAESAAPARA